MAVKTKDEILASIKDKFKDDDSDDTLSFLEDISDTLDDMSEQVTKSGEWKAKYEQNDKDWREKYKARFFSTSDIDDEEITDPPTDPQTEPKKALSYEDLFKEGE